MEFPKYEDQAEWRRRTSYSILALGALASMVLMSLARASGGYKFANIITPTPDETASNATFFGVVQRELDPKPRWLLSRPLVSHTAIFTVALLFSTWLLAHLVKVNAASNGGDLESVSLDRVLLNEILGDPFVSFSHMTNWFAALNLRRDENQIEATPLARHRKLWMILAVMGIFTLEGGTSAALTFGSLGSTSSAFEVLGVTKVLFDLDDFKIQGVYNDSVLYSTQTCQVIELTGGGGFPSVVSSYIGCTTVASNGFSKLNSSSLKNLNYTGFYHYDDTGIGPEGSILGVIDVNGERHAAIYTVRHAVVGNADPGVVGFVKSSDEVKPRSDFLFTRCPEDTMGTRELESLNGRVLGACHVELLKYIGQEIWRHSGVQLLSEEGKGAAPSNTMTDRLLAAHAVSSLGIGMAIAFLLSVVAGLAKKEAVVVTLLALSQNIPGGCGLHVSQLRGIRVGVKKSYLDPDDTLARFRLVTGVYALTVRKMVSIFNRYGKEKYLRVIHAMNRCNVELSERLWQELSKSDEDQGELVHGEEEGAPSIQSESELHLAGDYEDESMDEEEVEDTSSLAFALRRAKGKKLRNLQRKFFVGRVAFMVDGQPVGELDEEAEDRLRELEVSRQPPVRTHLSVVRTNSSAEREDLNSAMIYGTELY